MSTKFTTPRGMLNWVFVGKTQPLKKPTDAPKYTCEILIPDALMRIKNPNTGFTPLEQIHAAILEAWNSKNPPAKQLKNADKIKSTLKFLSPDDEDLQPYMKGMWRLAAKNKDVPGVVDASVETMNQDAILKIKSGDYGKLNCNAYFYEVDGSKGVAFSLQGLQFIQAGKSIVGGKANLKEEFTTEELTEEDAEQAFKD